MIVDYNLESIDSVAQAVIKALKHKVVLFDGAMGTGKTTLIKALVKRLGSTDDVSSPTFSLVNTYQATNSDIYHFDLYRLNSIEEAYDFGIEDYLESTNWLFIEWPEIIKELLSDDYHIISLEHLGTEKRQLTLK
ncbi:MULTISPECIES: tRNA (adenosine(37)-N6)-threonylcarbamoyltransferase complex ATPase subunit type 1 TsaE [Bizionia]|uniref:tRNA threonylcarbamoyladenosine biosynthesis protein TsaE n=1 Tax=Bizionia algoritergicola TaxID=291187 RepID=A0A5D0QWN4_9FLAO|nr:MULTISPECIES: tRNA (adenosine(37)-N6)-threonylcarbamoyltransferase complex ATPase subunit type 1 TsaE [Bizionia]OBX24133.1 tRNA (N6-adenosine(37)-N6)-threonylcarbamoyltransferase complex ATPase TsaE [Bizionia sp. APA-3]TYB73643.1 tRNA (adenosine(37)-N6)-threonylcarbamoyltransferase complex ATPase subunit type 1 TsaE [Bizionia algoritergicola]